MRLSWFTEALPLLTLLRFGQCLLEERIVSFEPVGSSNGTQLRLTQAPVIIADDDVVGIKIAADSLADDLAQITDQGRDVKKLNASQGFEIAIQGAETAIIAGSFNSSIIRHLVSTGSLNISDIAGKWETFKTTPVANPLPGVKKALVIAGSDKRGTIYGIYTLSEQAGQFPYHWFADVPAKKHSEIYALPKISIQGEPTVKYRGLFINDEEPALNTWWSRAHNAGPTGGGKYARVKLKPGKRHRLRIINTSVDNTFTVSLVNHQFTVIQTDFVPVNAFTTSSLFLAIGQRYDVTIDASQTVGNYWFNVTFAASGLCGVSNMPFPAAIFQYEGASSTALPTIKGTAPPDSLCQDNTNFVPIISRSAPAASFSATPSNSLDLNLATQTWEGQQRVYWKIKGQDINITWDEPTLEYVAKGNLNLYPVRLSC